MATQTPLDVRHGGPSDRNGKDVAPARVEEAVHVRILVDRKSAMGDAATFWTELPLFQLESGSDCSDAGVHARGSIPVHRILPCRACAA